MNDVVGEGLRAIVQNLKLDSLGVQELLESIGPHFGKLQEELHIAYLRVNTHMPQNDDISQPIIRRENLLAREGVTAGAESFAQTFGTPADGKIVLEAFPEEGITWNDSDKEQIAVVLKLIFVLTSRARVYGSYNTILRFDYMTGAFNAFGMIEESIRLKAKGDFPKYFALFLNVKEMGAFNRQYGAQMGDRLLTEFVKQMKEYIGDDGFVGRRGGDNFTVYILKEKFQDLVDFLSTISVPIENYNGTKYVPVRLRMGIYEIQTEDDYRVVFERCNMAFQQTKMQNSPDVCIFSMALNEVIIRGQELASRIKQGLLNDEFIPYFQPKVDTKTFEMIGAEALVRWDRDGVIVAPGEFVPHMERIGLICDLDFIMFNQVCKQIRTWLDQGITPVRISCNFSRDHLSNDNLVSDIMEVVNRYKIDPRFIEIEITESSCFQNYEKLKKFLNDIRIQGVHVSIDDFGTGYSSLNMLSNFDVDTIKLDKSFLDNATDGKERDRVLFVNIIRMVADMGLHAITEGVETIEQVEFLRDVNCQSIQGYYFDKPLPCEEFEKRLLSPKYER